MGVREVISTTREFLHLLRAKKYLAPLPATGKDSIALRFQETVARHPHTVMIVFEGRSVTWEEFNTLSNQYAWHLRSLDINHGDTVSIFMENRIEFLAAIIALHKLGATAALINTNLREKPLIHCITVTESRKCLFGEELSAALEEVKDEVSLANSEDFLWIADSGISSCPEWANDLTAGSRTCSGGNLSETNEVNLSDKALYIFTSGTTGLPKAAILTHRRFLGSAVVSWKVGFRCSETDRMYVCLPLYHATGLMLGVGSCMLSGCSMFLRRKFSGSRFFDEVREHNTNMFIYIGEICRYLLNQPERNNDANNPLSTMMGNGLRPDIWMRFKNRFGIERIIEFYGASEGNVAFANLLNKDCTVGLTTNKIALVEYDIDEDEIILDIQGHCVPVKRGNPGLLIAEINPNAVFEGYTNKEATEKKIIRNAFEEGDAWFNSGDLIKEVDVGFSVGIKHYQFADRVGDTFRWKSENVSTNEVAEILNQYPQIHFSNVYGVEVPGADGRAGMAALNLDPGTNELDLEQLSNYVCRELPAYARPVFLRIKDDIDVTGTFKIVKGEARREGYNPALVKDRLYVMKPRSENYVPLDDEFFETIQRGKAGY